MPQANDGFVWCGEPQKVVGIVRQMISTFYDLTNAPSIVLALESFRQKLVTSYHKHRVSMEDKEVFFTKYMQYSPYAKFSSLTAHELIMAFLPYYIRTTFQQYGCVPFSSIDSIVLLVIYILTNDPNSLLFKETD